MEKIKLGIIGVGNMGSAHAKNIIEGKCPEIELAAIADTNPDRLAWAKEQGYGENVKYFPTAEEMLDSGVVNACIVSVPHYSHTKYAIECMKRSIHVMVEKPAAVYTKQVKEMNAEADKHPEVVFGMMFNQRTNPVYIKLRELVQSGKFGQIRRTNWIITNWYRPQSYYDSGDWRATWAGEGGGVLLNQAPHQIDLWQWICGMPVKVTSHLKFGKWHDIEVEDDATIFVEYANGATGVFITTTGDCYGSNRLEIQMDKAKILLDNGKINICEYEMTEQEFSASHRPAFEVMKKNFYNVEVEGTTPDHVGVLNAWSNAILHGGKLVAEGKEGINELTLSNAMHLSAFLGKTVEIPFDDELYYEELMKKVATSKVKNTGKTVFSDTSSTYGGTK